MNKCVLITHLIINRTDIQKSILSALPKYNKGMAKSTNKTPQTS